MYAFISNEFQTIVNSQSNLQLLCDLYSYPKFKKVDTYEEGMKYIESCKRKFKKSGKTIFGIKRTTAYLDINYFINDNNIYLNIRTSNFGYISMENLPDNMKSVATYDLVKIKISNIQIDDSRISSHCIAVYQILRLFDNSINIVLTLPDLSVYLACTRYVGKNHVIKGVQDLIKSRVGKTIFIVKNG